MHCSGFCITTDFTDVTVKSFIQHENNTWFIFAGGRISHALWWFCKLWCSKFFCNSALSMHSSVQTRQIDATENFNATKAKGKKTNWNYCIFVCVAGCIQAETATRNTTTIAEWRPKQWKIWDWTLHKRHEIQIWGIIG